MKLGKTLYVANRKEWRAWLRKHHSSAREIWLLYYKKESGKPRIPYNDAVEEALCYGWIDGQTKSVDAEKWAQRFSPRRPGGNWSAMNIERLRRLAARRKVTKAGFAAAPGGLRGVTRSAAPKPARIPPDILRSLKRHPDAWKNFQKFPASYKRIRIGWIDASRNRPDFFRKRLDYFIRMTAQNKRFGMVQ